MSFSLDPTGVALCTLAAFALYRLSVWAAQRRNRPPYPPGPAGLPIVGYLNIPKESGWITYRDWSRIYSSDVLRIHVLGMNIIILDSFEAATDLLDKRSTIYSDRPGSGITMLTDPKLCGLGWAFALQQYTQEWRDGRKAFQREFHLSTVKKYRPTELKETHRLLNRLLETPEEFLNHLKLFTGAQIMSIGYGIDVQDQGDPLIARAEHVLEAVNSLHPGRYLVDILTFLKHVPEWVPGATFKTDARLWRESAEALRDVPYKLVKDKMTNDPASAADCVAKSLIENTVNEAKDPVYMEHIAKSVAGTMYLAGTDTIHASLTVFFHAMVLFPEIMRRAQASIDRVCDGRLPDFSDFDALPFTHALLRETLRWNPTTPINVPHRSMADDVYRDYFIPKGSIVIVNNWSLLHDPEVYADPERFNPDRFLKPAASARAAHEVELDTDIRDPADIIFGFGRRGCPGRHMAYDSLWIVFVSVLAAFDIEAVKNEKGEPMMPSMELEGSFSVHPKAFKCVIKPRSAAHEALVRETMLRE